MNSNYGSMTTEELKAEFERCLHMAEEIATQKGLNQAEYRGALQVADDWVSDAERIEEVLNRRGWRWYPQIKEWHPTEAN